MKTKLYTKLTLTCVLSVASVLNVSAQALQHTGSNSARTYHPSSGTTSPPPGRIYSGNSSRPQIARRDNPNSLSARNTRGFSRENPSAFNGQNTETSDPNSSGKSFDSAIEQALFGDNEKQSDVVDTFQQKYGKQGDYKAGVSDCSAFVAAHLAAGGLNDADAGSDAVYKSANIAENLRESPQFKKTGQPNLSDAEKGCYLYFKSKSSNQGHIELVTGAPYNDPTHKNRETIPTFGCRGTGGDAAGHNKSQCSNGTFHSEWLNNQTDVELFCPKSSDTSPNTQSSDSQTPAQSRVSASRNPAGSSQYLFAPGQLR